MGKITHLIYLTFKKAISAPEVSYWLKYVIYRTLRHPEGHGV